jgi:choline dehydrogenase-like flavoprotein
VRSCRSSAFRSSTTCPGVGKNLQDHPDYVFNYRARSLDLLGISPGGAMRLIKEIGRYRRDRTGMMTSNGAEGGGFLRRFPDSPAPDFQLHFVVGLIDNHARKLHWDTAIPATSACCGRRASARSDWPAPIRRRPPSSTRIFSAIPTISTPWSMASS